MAVADVQRLRRLARHAETPWVGASPHARLRATACHVEGRRSHGQTQTDVTPFGHTEPRDRARRRDRSQLEAAVRLRAAPKLRPLLGKATLETILAPPPWQNSIIRCVRAGRRRSSPGVAEHRGLAQSSPGGLACGGRPTKAPVSWVHAVRRSKILACAPRTTV